MLNLIWRNIDRVGWSVGHPAFFFTENRASMEVLLLTIENEIMGGSWIAGNQNGGIVEFHVITAECQLQD